MFVPGRAILNAMMTALVTALTGAADPNFWKVKLYVNNVTPNPDSAVDDFVLADFTGSDPIDLPDAVAPTDYTDPLSGDHVFEVAQPEGGLTFISAGTVEPPQMVYGYIITDSTGAFFKGGEKFDEPITIATLNDGVDVESIKARLNDLDIFLS